MISRINDLLLNVQYIYSQLIRILSHVPYQSHILAVAVAAAEVEAEEEVVVVVAEGANSELRKLIK